MKRLLTALFLLSAAPALGASPPDSPARSSFDAGMRALTARDFTGALAAFGPLAAAGNGDAQFMLGVMHENGLGVARDLAAAASWYAKAARAGIASAQYNLAVFYQLGKGVAKDPGQALYWFRKAAEQGHSRAQNNLGTIYFTGAGVTRDPIEAWKWLTLAADGLRGEKRAVARRNLATIEDGLSPAALAEAKRRVAAWRARR